MNTFNKLFSRQFYRSIPFWLLFLLALYSVLGFFVLPKVIDSTIKEQVSSRLGWQTKIEKIAFNPFLFTLSIDNLDIRDAKSKAISFTRLHADFELRSITEGAYTFKEIALVDPNFHLEIDKAGKMRIQNALAAHPQPVDPEAEATPAAPSATPKLLFDSIKIVNGVVSANDESRGEPIKHHLDDINFELQHFSTYVEKGGDYQLHITLNEDQSIDWKGNIAVAPIASQGTFALTGIKIERFWPYLAPLSPYKLLHSSTDLQADYTLSYIDDRLQLQLSEANIAMNDIALADPQKDTPFLNIKKISVGPTKFDLLKQSVAIENVVLDSIDLDVVRDKEAQIEFLTPLDAFLAKSTTSEPAPETDADAPGFMWSVDNIALNDSSVQVTDQFVTGGAAIKVHNINAQLAQLNQSLSNKQPFSLDYQVESSGKNSLSGEMVAQPFSIETDIKLAALPIPIIQPYVAEIAHVEIQKGTVSLDGHSNLTPDADDGLTGLFKGSVAIDNFETLDTITKQRILGWQKLSVSPFTINLLPLEINIDQIALDKPYSRVVITEDRLVNLTQLMIDKGEPKTETDSTENAADIKIKEILLKDGGAYFADLSLIPQFSTSIENLNGSIKGLSSNNLESADVDLSGSIEEYGKMLVDGKINPLSGDLTTDIDVNFEKIELTTMTPYSARYIGYNIDKGKMNLGLNYKISKGILDGSNRLILDQFELGEKVESKEAIDLPLKLALALFKDSDGIIDINLPTKGDMNSPDFEIGGIVVKALVNVMTKAVTAPFSMLANLVGGDEDALKSVSFALGSATLSEQEKKNIATLSELLIKRPQLVLELRVQVDSSKDKKQLQLQAVEKQLDLSNKNAQQQLTATESALVQLMGEESVKNIKNQLVAAQGEQQSVDESAFNQQYQQALMNRLVSLQPIKDLQLSELAQQRISSIKNQLIKVNKVDSKQIFALQPSLKGSAEGAVINTIFSLTGK